MARVKFIQHRGIEIFSIDFSGGTTADVRDIIREAAPMIRSRPPKSVLTLTYTPGGKFDRDVISELKEFTRGNEPYVKAAAIVGVQGMQRIVLDTVAMFSRREFATFDDLEAAKSYLCSKA